MATLGIIGSGIIGSNVARIAVAAGYDVLISNSRGPETLQDLAAELGPRARAVEPAQAAADADLVLISVPHGAVSGLPRDALAGRIVMDPTNYYPQQSGRIPELDANEMTTSERVQALLPGARVVKAFNSIFAKHIVPDATPPGTPDRRALPVAGDDAEAKEQVAAFLDAVGYDAVDIGSLADSWRVERDTPTYGKRVTRAELEAILPTVERVQQV